jgi:hypothetical protein
MSGICVTNVCSIYKPGSFARADTAALESDAHVILGNVPAKFHIPIRIATVPGHAFNAVQLDSNPADVNSWLFIEPQTDEVFFASDPRMTSVANIYAGSGIFTLSRLTGYSRGFQQTDEKKFSFNRCGNFYKSSFYRLPSECFLITFYETFL